MTGRGVLGASRLAVVLFLLALPAAIAGAPARTWAQGPAAVASSGGEVEPLNDSDGFTPAPEAAAAPAVAINGYVDVGFADAGGDGTSFAPGDLRVPADYGVDTFATAVNSRGDVASTDPRGVFVNGFLPRSAGIGGRPSFLLNTMAVDFKYAAPSAPLTVFSRVHFLPRLGGGADDGRVLVEQAFGRLIPFESQEMAVAIGKFDSVFGIEYLDNQSNIRTGITPSLVARYTTGQSIGGKVFYRIQLAPIWSAISVNAAVTNSGNFVESLQSPDASLAGAPVGSGRLGYELNLPHVQVKVGGSALYGARNDQPDRGARQRAFGADVRVAVRGLYASGEYVAVDEEGSAALKTTPLGTFPFVSAFHARGGYLQLAWGLPVGAGALRKVTVYGRYDRRRAEFEGFTPLTVDRFTAGVRIDVWESVIVKGEWLKNRELAGAPTVANDVLTSSLVYSW